MFTTIEDYLTHLHASHIPFDGPEVERRLCRCRNHGVGIGGVEACPRMSIDEWLKALTTGGPGDARGICVRWG